VEDQNIFSVNQQKDSSWCQVSCPLHYIKANDPLAIRTADYTHYHNDHQSIINPYTSELDLSSITPLW